MDKIVNAGGYTIIILIVLSAMFYVLYINGYLVINAKKALMYIGSNKGKNAKFSSCDGYIKRIVRFKENRTYRFEFSTELEKGDVTIELLDAKKHKVLCLTGEQNCASIHLTKNSRYYLIYRFKSATGNLVLKWD